MYTGIMGVVDISSQKSVEKTGVASQIWEKEKSISARYAS